MAFALIALAVAWVLGIGRGPIKVDEDVRAHHLALRAQYLEATSAWLEAVAAAQQAQATLDAKDKVRGVPDTYLEALAAYGATQGVLILFHIVNLRAEIRGRAAAELIDFQAEMLEELTDIPIASPAVAVEPDYGSRPRP